MRICPAGTPEAYIATARLRAFGGRSIQDVETWDEDDERIANLIADGLINRQTQRVKILGDDAQLLAAVNRGEWALKGFRNREIRLLLFGPTQDIKQRRSQAAKVSRRLALLHAHGLIAQVSRTYRWQVPPKGRRILTAVLAARQADTDKLMSLAA